MKSDLNLRSLAGVAAIATLLAVFALSPLRGFADGECCGAHLGPPPLSAVDCTLRPYFVPRRPAWGGNQFRYRVEIPDESWACVPNCGAGGDLCPADGLPFPPEVANAFDPVEFESLGQIPNDSLFDATPAAARPGR